MALKRFLFDGLISVDKTLLTELYFRGLTRIYRLAALSKATLDRNSPLSLKSVEPTFMDSIDERTDSRPDGTDLQALLTEAGIEMSLRANFS